MTPIYLDHHATTPCDPRVLEAMLPAFSGSFGNASSRQHLHGRAAAALVERAREQVAALIECSPQEIVFTSGATESNNLAIKGAARSRPADGEGAHIVTSVVEHRSVLDPCERLEREGFRVAFLPVDGGGRVSPDAVAESIGPGTVLVSIQLANNEVGAVQPVREIGALCKERGVLFHCDAVQALPWLEGSVEDLGIDLLSISAHKMYGPKGAGALYVRRRRPHVRLVPLLDGGGHERGLRPGTLNVPGIVGLGKACEIALAERDHDRAQVARLRDRLLEGIRAGVPDTAVNGSIEHRLPNNLNVSFPGVESARLLEALEDRVSASSGSACSSATADGSYVILAMTGSRERADGSIRFGLGRATTEAEVERAAREVIAAVSRLRSAPGAGAERECGGARAPARNLQCPRN